MQDTAGRATATTPAAAGGSGHRWVRIPLAFVVMAIAAMWVYVLFIADPQTPNRLDDQVWAERAEVVCAGVASRIDALPPASSFRDIEPEVEALRQRADVGEEANALLAGQLVQLRALPAPTGEHDGLLLDAWLDDWDVYLADRQAHVEEWRAGEDRPFAESEADSGGPISDRMNELAKVNGMASCVVPQDVG